MYDNYNYPPGADTPDAPWNQVDLKDIYGDEADNTIDGEIDYKDERFVEWACDCGYLPEDFADEDIDKIIKDNKIRGEYHDFRFDDVLEEIAENEYEEREYHRSEAFERMRERRLLGEY